MDGQAGVRPAFSGQVAELCVGTRGGGLLGPEAMPAGEEERAKLLATWGCQARLESGNAPDRK